MLTRVANDTRNIYVDIRCELESNIIQTKLFNECVILSNKNFKQSEKCVILLSDFLSKF